MSVQTVEASPLRAVGVCAWALATAMIGAIVVGVATAADGAVAELTGNVWGRVTIIDLYLALGLAWAWIAWRERSAGRAMGWGVGLIVTGSVALCVYVALACRSARTIPELLAGRNDITPD